MRKPYFVLFGLLVFAACSKPDSPAPAPPRPADSAGRPVSTPPYVVPTDSTGWRRLNSNGYPFFVDIHFTDTLHGFACGSDGHLYSSGDGGLSWSNVPGVQASTKTFLNFFFLNNRQGYCISYTDLAITMDGGLTWKVKPINIPLQQFHWVNLQFVTPSTGFFTSATGTYASADTGTSWRQVNSKPAAALSFSDAQNGMIYAEPDSLYRTSDGGLHWTPYAGIAHAFKVSGDTYATLQFTDALHGWLMDGLAVYASADGGLSWKGVISAQDSSLQYLADLKMIDDQTGYLMASSKVLKTTNGGASFTPVYGLPSSSMQSLNFVDERHGWACGMGSTGAQSVLLKYSH